MHSVHSEYWLNAAHGTAFATAVNALELKIISRLLLVFICKFFAELLCIFLAQQCATWNDLLSLCQDGLGAWYGAWRLCYQRVVQSECAINGETPDKPCDKDVDRNLRRQRQATAQWGTSEVVGLKFKYQESRLGKNYYADGFRKQN